MRAVKVTRGWIDSHHLGDVRVQALGVCPQSVMSTVAIRSNLKPRIQYEGGPETCFVAIKGLYRRDHFIERPRHRRHTSSQGPRDARPTSRRLSMTISSMTALAKSPTSSEMNCVNHTDGHARPARGACVTARATQYSSVATVAIRTGERAGRPSWRLPGSTSPSFFIARTTTVRCSLSPASAPKANDRALPTWMAKVAVACCRIHCAQVAPLLPPVEKGFM